MFFSKFKMLLMHKAPEAPEELRFCFVFLFFLPTYICVWHDTGTFYLMTLESQSAISLHMDSSHLEAMKGVMSSSNGKET